MGDPEPSAPSPAPPDSSGEEAEFEFPEAIPAIPGAADVGEDDIRIDIEEADDPPEASPPKAGEGGIRIGTGGAEDPPEVPAAQAGEADIRIGIGEADSPAEAPGSEFQFSFDAFPADGASAGDGGFDFQFDEFPDDAGASFTFDANQEPPPASESEILFEKFLGLIGNPCFAYSGRPLVELFRQEDPTDSAEAARALLLGNRQT
jgi:hypothetical protein